MECCTLHSSYGLATNSRRHFCSMLKIQVAVHQAVSCRPSAVAAALSASLTCVSAFPSKLLPGHWDSGSSHAFASDRPMPQMLQTVSVGGGAQVIGGGGNKAKTTLQGVFVGQHCVRVSLLVHTYGTYMSGSTSAVHGQPAATHRSWQRLWQPSASS